MMYSGNVWSFDPFQQQRKYKFRLKSTGQTVIGIYKQEKTKATPVQAAAERQYEFETEDGLQIVSAAEIVDPQYVGY